MCIFNFQCLLFRNYSAHRFCQSNTKCKDEDKISGIRNQSEKGVKHFIVGLKYDICVGYKYCIFYKSEGKFNYSTQNDTKLK